MNETGAKLIDESSDEEDNELVTTSPRKRTRRVCRKSDKLELDSFLGPLDANGFLDVETFLSDDFDWLEPLQKTIKDLNPDCVQVNPQVQPLEAVSYTHLTLPTIYSV